MPRFVLAASFLTVLLAGCNCPSSTPPKKTGREIRIETPNSEIKIRREKTESPTGQKEGHIEIEKKDKR